MGHILVSNCQHNNYDKVFFFNQNEFEQRGKVESISSFMTNIGSFRVRTIWDFPWSIITFAFNGHSEVNAGVWELTKTSSDYNLDYHCFHLFVRRGSGMVWPEMTLNDRDLRYPPQSVWSLGLLFALGSQFLLLWRRFTASNVDTHLKILSGSFFPV